MDIEWQPCVVTGILHYASLSAISPRLRARANLWSASSCSFFDIVLKEKVSPKDRELLFVDEFVFLLSENAHANSSSLVIPPEF